MAISHAINAVIKREISIRHQMKNQKRKRQACVVKYVIGNFYKGRFQISLPYLEEVDLII